MARPIDAPFDAGGDRLEGGHLQESPGDAETAALDPGHLDFIQGPEDKDMDLTVLARGPEAAGDSIVERPLDDLDDIAAERAEFVAWLEKFSEADDGAFTASEREEILGEIGQLRAQIKALSLEQRKALEQSLEKLQSGSERMGRKDWFIYAIGVGTTLIITEIVPPLVLLPLAVHAFHALSHLFIFDA